MDEPFDIPVTYKGQDVAFTARLLQLGYTHKFSIDVYGQEVLFEPDEERNYRALIDPEQEGKGEKLDAELLKAIATAIEEILR